MAPGSDTGCGKNANGPRSLGPAVRTGTTHGPAPYRTCRGPMLSVRQRPSKAEGHRGPPRPCGAHTPAQRCLRGHVPAPTLPAPLQSAEGIPDIHLKHLCPHQLLGFPHTCSPPRLPSSETGILVFQRLRPQPLASSLHIHAQPTSKACWPHPSFHPEPTCSSPVRPSPPWAWMETGASAWVSPPPPSPLRPLSTQPTKEPHVKSDPISSTQTHLPTPSHFTPS